MIRNLIGVIGPGEMATSQSMTTAYALGQAIAQQGWTLITGGRAAGVMEAASQGAQSAQGLVVGILPDENRSQMSSAVDIPIVTGMGHGRNVINILSSQIVIACGLGPGTLSEIAFAIKLQRPLLLMHIEPTTVELLTALAPSSLQRVESVEDAIASIHQLLALNEQPPG
jgi:uncharacterized protein (TIGR00725 family)